MLTIATGRQKTYWRCAAISLILFALTACSSLTRSPLPADQAPSAAISGFGEVRFYPLTDISSTRKSIEASFMGETPDNYETTPDGGRTYNYLAISGGGSAGAFGAGLINGATQAGHRPNFKVVTGVSTGSLIAPFAFLGPEYDKQIRDSYTTVDASRIYIMGSLLSLLWRESAADTGPLKELIAAQIDEKLLDAVAKEHAKGRRLYVATSNLDRQEPVIWDMGAIASSKSPARLKLFREVLLASASIPSLFPPVYIDVTVGGKKYDEMHVDGGVFLQAFFVGGMVNLQTAIQNGSPDFHGKLTQRLFVIRNGSVSSVYSPVKRGIGSISARAINTMLKVSGINDLYRLYLQSLHDKFEFRYIALPKDYVPLTDEEFNQKEMIQEYELGRKMAVEGIPWMTVPPGYSVE